VKIMYERVAGIDVHKDMVKVAIRGPGDRAWARTTEVLEFRTWYPSLRAMARLLRERGVTHVAMEAAGVYHRPVYLALEEEGWFTEILVVNPAHIKALKGHKTDALDSRRTAELLECGLLAGSYMPSRDQEELRDLTRYRTRTVQARSSAAQRFTKTLESAAIKVASVTGSVTGTSVTAMTEALIAGERDPAALAGLAKSHLRQAGKQADLKLALAGRFGPHHALMCRLHLDDLDRYDKAITQIEAQIGALAEKWRETAGLLTTIPGFGQTVAVTWIAEIGPEPHRWFPAAGHLASWVSLCPGNYISARKPKHGATGDAGTWIKPVLIQAAWAAIRVPGRIQARYNRLVRRPGGPKNPAARKKAITAIAHTLLKIAYAVLEAGKPCTDLGEDFYRSRDTPAGREAYHRRQIEELHPAAPSPSPSPLARPGLAAPPGRTYPRRGQARARGPARACAPGGQVTRRLTPPSGGA
jgi:transposase